ncbi:MAG: hypothetical protein EPN23_06600 [Verrucomicrobia bacterium]|nr:MAG: hypothetical protein EPN23_06600 [Verrucomicrobiota bacterium]
MFLDDANRFAFAADLGLDKVLIYRFDGMVGTLPPNDPPCANLAPGSVPRHLAFQSVNYKIMTWVAISPFFVGMVW